MAELVLNGGFEFNTPPSTFANWNIQNDAQVGIGTGIGGTDCFQSGFPPNTQFGGSVSQTQGQILTPSTGYNLSCFINVTQVFGAGQALYQFNANFPSAPGLNFSAAVGVGLATGPFGVFVQYTTNFTSSAFTSEPYSINFVASSAKPFSGLAAPPVLFDNLSMKALEVCMAGETVIAAKDLETDQSIDLAVSELDPNKHLVFSHTHNDYVKLVKTVKSGPVKRIYEIPALRLSDLQYQAVRLTGGHKVLFDGSEIKARDLVGAKRVKCSPAITVYTIVLEKEGYVIGNGALIKASGSGELQAYRDKINV